ncbi:ABC transporter G family member 11 [Spathaspora sp. JA1]|nr:ABC transporter G family member 11 [Spathaspora sp. JA1]
MSSKAQVLSWSNINLQLSNGNKQVLIDNVSGSVSAGQMLAIMGPSGSGKSTLLNILAHRSKPGSSIQSGEIKINNEHANLAKIKQLSSYVEQEDHLIGSLTVLETVDYSAKFAGVDKSFRRQLVDKTLSMLGLENQRDVKIGSPIQKGISGGQKRRVSIASQMITTPSILFLDEPTSGLDSVASREVISTIKKIASEENMIVICSIHQPSTYTFELFDDVLFLSRGKTVYHGKVEKVVKYFDSVGYTIPPYINPSEYVLDLINTDFTVDQNSEEKMEVLDDLVNKWRSSHVAEEKEQGESDEIELDKYDAKKEVRNTLILVSRVLIKARRDILTYYVRMVMYLGLAILMGTVWLRLGNGQHNIQPFINAIFFSGAFMSFMSVAYIPSYIEDLLSYKKERLNGLYGPFAFTISNFLVGLPFIFLIATMFSIVTFFMVNFNPTATGFFYYLMWLFLDLVAAESMTIFIASIFPNFVIALALTAFANGLWMAVGGFLVPSNILNVFWYYTFYWVDYQRYVFQGMMFNEFDNRNFNCDNNCFCMYDSPLASQCQIEGSAVLNQLGYGKYDKGLWIGVLIAIIFFYRVASYLVLRYRK